MQIKHILNSLFLTSLCANVYAARDDCKELGTLLNSQALTGCKMNGNGEMIELEIFGNDESIPVEAYKKAFSYQTIKKFTFYSEYNDCEQLTNGLTNLKNLEELHISSFRGGLVPNTLKGLNSLKQFSFTSGDFGGLGKEVLEELGTLTNLESLTFGYAGLSEDGLKALQNLNKVTSLKLFTNDKTTMNVEGCLANLKNVKNLTVTYTIRDQSQFDAITSYNNLEVLDISLNEKIKCDNFKNLTKLNTLNIYVDGNEVPSCVKAIPNLKKLTFKGKDYPIQNGNGTTTTGNNPSQTPGNNPSQTPGNNASQTPGNNPNQAIDNNANQVADNANQPLGNNADQTTGITINNGNATTTTEANNNTNDFSGASSTIVHAISFLPVIGIALKMLL